ncbi:MAG: NADH-quinone oxidoreductase subunit J [Syntrophotaleaceae bacterium]
MASILFYVLSAAALLATLLSITRKNPVHAVVFLVNALFALALLFYLLGAPLVAAWEVIIYAGAVMVLFLFVIMMLNVAPGQAMHAVGRGQKVLALLLFLVLFLSAGVIVLQDPAGSAGIPLFHLSPREFGYTLFSRFGLAVKILSFHLLFAGTGAWYLGRRRRQIQREEQS